MVVETTDFFRNGNARGGTRNLLRGPWLYKVYIGSGVIAYLADTDFLVGTRAGGGGGTWLVFSLPSLERERSVRLVREYIGILQKLLTTDRLAH